MKGNFIKCKKQSIDYDSQYKTFESKLIDISKLNEDDKNFAILEFRIEEFLRKKDPKQMYFYTSYDRCVINRRETELEKELMKIRNSVKTDDKKILRKTVSKHLGMPILTYNKPIRDVIKHLNSRKRKSRSRILGMNIIEREKSDTIRNLFENINKNVKKLNFIYEKGDKLDDFITNLSEYEINKILYHLCTGLSILKFSGMILHNVNIIVLKKGNLIFNVAFSDFNPKYLGLYEPSDFIKKLYILGTSDKNLSKILSGKRLRSNYGRKLHDFISKYSNLLGDKKKYVYEYRENLKNVMKKGFKLKLNREDSKFHDFMEKYILKNVGMLFKKSKYFDKNLFIKNITQENIFKRDNLLTLINKLRKIVFVEKYYDLLLYKDYLINKYDKFYVIEPHISKNKRLGEYNEYVSKIVNLNNINEEERKFRKVEIYIQSFFSTVFKEEPTYGIVSRSLERIYIDNKNNKNLLFARKNILDKCGLKYNGYFLNLVYNKNDCYDFNTEIKKMNNKEINRILLCMCFILGLMTRKFKMFIYNINKEHIFLTKFKGKFFPQISTMDPNFIDIPKLTKGYSVQSGYEDRFIEYDDLKNLPKNYLEIFYYLGYAEDKTLDAILKGKVLNTSYYRELKDFIDNSGPNKYSKPFRILKRRVVKKRYRENYIENLSKLGIPILNQLFNIPRKDQVNYFEHIYKSNYIPNTSSIVQLFIEKYILKSIGMLFEDSRHFATNEYIRNIIQTNTFRRSSLDSLIEDLQREIR